MAMESKSAEMELPASQHHILHLQYVGLYLCLLEDVLNASQHFHQRSSDRQRQDTLTALHNLGSSGSVWELVYACT